MIYWQTTRSKDKRRGGFNGVQDTINNKVQTDDARIQKHMSTEDQRNRKSLTKLYVLNTLL